MPGEQGPPGEVTLQALDDAIATTALNPASVTTLDLIAALSYDAAQMQAVMDKVDELVDALKR